MLLEFVERLDLRNVVLVVQDWGGLLGLTLPMAAPERYRGLLVMNTTLGTGDAPLSPGFLAWREMCAKNPEFDVAPPVRARQSADGRRGMRGLRRAVSRRAAIAPRCAPFRPWCRSAPMRTAPPCRAQARDFWSQRLGRPARMMAVGAQDPVLGVPVMEALRAQIRGCPEPMVLPQAGHFVQEHGEAVARAAVGYFRP